MIVVTGNDQFDARGQMLFPFLALLLHHEKRKREADYAEGRAAGEWSTRLAERRNRLRGNQRHLRKVK